ncbi:Tuberin [Armadillidium nasatum]|uniref:Tuberin n=1 Tax=Armadillidium nasatum TaxID=96803 RepID=A0A5N5TBF6_9CRUS|nr:Tuberin [Armadillidium nasatum]
MKLMVLNHVFQAKSLEEVNSCLKFMDTLIAYVFVPSGALTKFVATLARLVSIPSIVGDTWKVMRNLLRTELGNTALCSLCELIENEDNFHITRGSIYFVTNAMWSKHKITSLTFRTMAVLTTLRKASESIHPLVIYETAISLSKLVRNHPEELHLPAWDITLDILEKLFAFTANYSNKEQAQMIFNVLNNTIDDIEDQISRDAFYGSLSKFYDLVDSYSIQRNPNSISMLLSYKTRLMGPGLGIWLEELSGLMHRHFKLETRAAVRLHALSKLKSIFDNYKWTYHADEICEQVVVTQLNEIEKDPDLNVRKEGVSLLIHMAVILKSSVVKTLLHFIGNIVFLPYKFLNLNLSQVSQVSEEEVSLVLQDSRKILDAEKPKIYQEGEVEDIYEGVRGLILIFKKKIWCLPSEFAIDAYQILMLVLQCHYTYPEVLGKVSCIRKEIFQMIFEMRADANYHLGLPNCPDAQIPIDPEDPEDLKEFIPNYTPYIVIDHKHGEKLKPGFDLLLSSKSSLQSSYEGDDEDDDDGEQSLVEQSDEKEIDTKRLLYPKGKINMKEDDTDSGREQEAAPDIDIDVDSLEPRTVITHLSLTKAAMSVIVAMKKEKDWTLLKMILEKVPEVLQNKALILSKQGNDIDYLATTLCSLITDSTLCIPDSLHNTPQKFTKSDFDGYVYPVMASLLSYHQHLKILYQKNVIQCLQNGMSSKSAPQCVSALTLCVLEMRSTMAKLLREIMIQLSKISATVQNAQPTLEFLSTLLHLPRVYSDFLPSQYLSVFAISIPYANPFKFNHYIVSLAYHGGKSDNIDMNQFHKDLRETCVDFMARNCFNSFAPETTRTPLQQMLFDRGQQMSWLVGTRIITVTTSGCSQKPIKQGLCDKCVKYCLMEDPVAQEPPPASQPDSTASRRRHKSDFHRSVSHEVKYQPQTKDDLHMMRASFKEPHPSEAGTVTYAVRIQNPQTHIVKEDVVPIQDLSSFYSPLSQGGSDLPVFGKESTFPEDSVFDLQQPTDSIRPRASSGASDRTQASETGLGLGEEWSNSGSGPSSGATSLASSETKLNTKVEGEIINKVGNGAVKRCNSSVGSPSPPPTAEQTNRIRHASAMQSKSCTSPVTTHDKDDDPNLQPVKRGRGHTISDMNPASRNRSTRSIQTRRPTIASTGSLLSAAFVSTASTTSLPSETSASTSNTIASSYSTSLTSSSKSSKESKGGYSPSSVFLQLYYQGCLGKNYFRPILLPTQNKDVERTIRLMDKIKPHEHHKIGVLYVGPNQTTEIEIFSNTCGSDRYHQFLDGLGSVHDISEFSENTNLGGLDKTGMDGRLIYMWQDDLMQVVFHVATSMPNKESDPNFNNKKQHIGNDYVTIVYNNSGKPYNLNTIKSQFNHSVVEITPGDHNTNCVKLLTKPALAEFVSWDSNDFPRLVSDSSLPLLGRQLAIHANLASTVWQSMKYPQSPPYATNWLEWLRKVRKLRELVLAKAEETRLSQLNQATQEDRDWQLYAYLDFSDMIEVEKSVDAKERSRTAGFLNRR